MSKRRNVRLLKRPQIDVVKWDETVRGHLVHFVYGYSWYLDAQGEWEALVYGDYEVVLPLPKKRKFGFTFYYSPWFCQQLGFFGAALNQDSVDALLSSIPFKIKSQISFNSGCVEFVDLKVDKRKNYRLDLASFELDSLSANRKRDLKKSSDLVVHWEEGVFNAALSFFKKNDAERFGLTVDYFEQFRQTCRAVESHGRVVQLKLSLKGELVGTGLFFVVKNGWYLMSISSLIEFKKLGVNTRLVYEAINKSKEEDCTYFDFEGSSIDSLARFYGSFGAEEMGYLVWNKRFL